MATEAKGAGTGARQQQRPDGSQTAPKPGSDGGPQPADEAAQQGPPPPDPKTCKGIALCQSHLESGILDGDWIDTDYLFFLEPAGVLNGRFKCVRCHPQQDVRAGILMTRQARMARRVYLDDALNPSEYELSFPKEYGYIKSRQHYQPESRQHARYPWSKKF